MALASGSRVGPYEIVALLGAGGMGEVYRARDSKLNRDVAIKILRTDVSVDDEKRRRFEQEARAASALNHPSIVHVYDVDATESLQYIAMELVEGRNLRDVLAAGPLPIRKLLDVAIEMTDGLAKAHSAGIVHRDLKPENLLITREGHVKIVDFGLAKLGDPTRQPPSEWPTLAKVQTVAGQIMGTTAYMSPEQASGRDVDFRSDQFSLGGILYEMASGRRAFERSSGAETWAAIFRDDPESLSRLNPAVPPILRQIIEERCLAKDPEERYDSTWDLLRDLRSVRDHLSEASAAKILPPAARRWRRVSGPVALALALGTGAFFIGQRTGRTLQLPPPTFRQITFQRGVIWSARFATDGETLVYAAAWEGRPVEPFLTRVGGPESRPLGFAGAEILAISATGEMAISRDPHFLGWSHAGTLARVALAGGAPRQLLDDVLWADWSPDGNTLAIVRAVAGKTQLEYPIGKVLYATAGMISHARVSPRGDLVAFLDHPELSDDRGFVAVVNASGEKRTLTREWDTAQGLAWAPSGDEVWFTASHSGIIRPLRAVTLAGRERTIATAPGHLMLYDISRSGRVLLGREATRSAILGVAPGDTKERDLSVLDWSVVMDLSSDGRSILLVEQGAGGGPNYSVYLRRTDGETPAVRLGDGEALALSPDGKWVLGLIPADMKHLNLLPTGTGEVKHLSESGLAYRPSGTFLPDGKRIICVASEPGRAVRVFVQDLDGGKPRPITPEGVSIPGGLHPVSPDGRFVAAIGPEGKGLLYPIDGGNPRPIPSLEAGEVPIRFDATGSSLYVFRREELPARVFSIDIATGRRQLLREIGPNEPAGILSIRRLQLTPDGKSYTYNAPRNLTDLYVVDGLK